MRIILAALFVALAAPALSQSALIAVKSAHDVPTTVARLENAIQSRGAAVVAKVDHAAGAKSVGQELRPTVVVIFGNPRLGTPLMQSNQQAGLDLPMRIAVWQDAQGAVWLGYAPPKDLAERHAIKDRDPVIQQMTGALAAIAAEAAKP